MYREAQYGFGIVLVDEEADEFIKNNHCWVEDITDNHGLVMSDETEENFVQYLEDGMVAGYAEFAIIFPFEKRCSLFGKQYNDKHECAEEIKKRFHYDFSGFDLEKHIAEYCYIEKYH